MKAQVIHTTGSDLVLIPPTMGQPNDNQFQGTVGEKLAEVACRICYDSMGLSKSRSSQALQYHIQDAPNLSVYEHVTLTIMVPAETERYALQLITCCFGRPGVRARIMGQMVHITANLRAILEWEKWSVRNWSIIGSLNIDGLCGHLGQTLLQAAKFDMPMALDRLSVGQTMYYERPKFEDLRDSERFISVWLYGSRGFTHEMVRHRFAMSQRSTRFVDELPRGWYDKDEHSLGWEEANKIFNDEIKCEGEFIVHPLTKKFVKDQDTSVEKKQEFFDRWQRLKEESRGLYKFLVENLQEYVGGDSTNARKQGRGAARLMLPNALASEMIYTASVADWMDFIIPQRATVLADAEIRQVIVEVVRDMPVVKNKYTFTEAPDGLGAVATRI